MSRRVERLISKSEANMDIPKRGPGKYSLRNDASRLVEEHRAVDGASSTMQHDMQPVPRMARQHAVRR